MITKRRPLSALEAELIEYKRATGETTATLEGPRCEVVTSTYCAAPANLEIEPEDEYPDLVRCYGCGMRNVCRECSALVSGAGLRGGRVRLCDNCREDRGLL